jgi:hypothetical protein
MDEVDDFLAHFGVKGMHWGKRKIPKQIAVPSQAKAKQLTAKERQAKRVKVARQLTIAAAGLAYAAPVLAHFGGVAIDQAVVRKKASNGRKYAEKMFSDSHGIANYDTIRLHQNPTTGNWV